MSVFRKKTDPMSARERTLQAEIKALEEEIRALSQSPNRPVTPAAQSDSRPSSSSAASRQEPRESPFEALPNPVSKPGFEVVETPDHYNELGLRKYDLLSAWRRCASFFRGPATTNPRLTNYLAAGGIKGLRPLRHEKRVARNRFLGLLLILVLVLWGLTAVLIGALH